MFGVLGWGLGLFAQFPECSTDIFGSPTRVLQEAHLHQSPHGVDSPCNGPVVYRQLANMSDESHLWFDHRIKCGMMVDEHLSHLPSLGIHKLTGGPTQSSAWHQKQEKTKNKNRMKRSGWDSPWKQAEGRSETMGDLRKKVGFKPRVKQWGIYGWPKWWNKRGESDRWRNRWVGNGGTGSRKRLTERWSLFQRSDKV